MQPGDLFAVRTTSSCNIVTTGEVRSIAYAGCVAFLFLRHTRQLTRFAATAGGRAYYTSGCQLYFSPVSDSLPPKL